MIAPFYLLMIEQKDEAFVASLEITVSGLASDKVQKADLPFTSKGELPVSRNRYSSLLCFLHHSLDSLRFKAYTGIAHIRRGIYH